MSSEARAATATETPQSLDMRMVSAAAILILLLRNYHNIVDAAFWAEDGSIFFQSAFNEGSLALLVKPYAGYLHMIPRLAALLASHVAIEWAPTLMNLFAICVQAFPLMYFLSDRSDPFLPTVKHKIVISLSFVLMPGLHELLGTVTNVQWFVPAMVLVVLFSHPPSSRFLRVLEMFALLLLVLTGPLSIFVAFAIAGAWVFNRWRPASHDRGRVAVVFAAAAVQSGFVLQSSRLAPSFHDCNARDGLVAIGKHVGMVPFIGHAGIDLIQRSTSPSVFGAFAFSMLPVVAAMLFVYPARYRNSFLLLNAAVFGASLAATFATLSGTCFSFLPNPTDGSRYFVYGVFIMIWSALLTLQDKDVLTVYRRVCGGLLLVSLVCAVPGDFLSRRNLAFSGAHWKEAVAKFYYPAQSGTAVTLVNPPNGWHPLELIRR